MKAPALLLLAALVCVIALLLAGRDRRPPLSQLNAAATSPPRRLLRQHDGTKDPWRVWRRVARSLETAGRSRRASPAFDMWRVDDDAAPTEDSDACERIFRDGAQRHVCAISM